MKKIFLICFLLSCSIQFVFAQVPTQAEIDKMLKDAQGIMKKYSTDTSVNKAMKGTQDRQKQINDSLKNQQSNNGVTNTLYTSDPGSYANVDHWKFPAKNTALLASLPKKVLSKAELVGFLNDIYLLVSKKLPPEVNSSVHSIAVKYKNDGSQMGDLAVLGWYTDYREEALLLIIKAAIISPDNGILLNNCAAILNMYGIEQYAIPVLKYVLQNYPGNSMLLNNLGQAYAGLGETDTAMVYLGRCIQNEPNNPEANNTAGQIEAARGNKEKAIAFFEKSIKTAYTKTAALKLQKIKKDSKIARLVRSRIKLPEYFNFFKYDLPDQCISTDNAALADAEHNAFRAMLTKQAQLYGSKYSVLAQKKAQEAIQLMNSNGAARKLKKNEFLAHPYAGFCGIMAGEIHSDYLKDVNDFNTRVTKKFASEMSSLTDDYKSKLKIINDGFTERLNNCGEGMANTNCPTDEEKCTAYNNIANEYLPKFAYLTEEFQKKGVLIFRTYFDELVYWHYLTLHPTGDDNFRMKYYEFIMQYLVTLGSITQTKIIKPCDFTPTNATKESNIIKEVDCPVDIVMGLGIGKIELNCEKFAISGGEGVLFGFEKNFKTKQSTVSIGIGVRLDLMIKTGPTSSGVGAQATEYAFITVDGNNGIADFGLTNEAKLTADAPIAGRKEVGVGSKFGINSGWDFNEGPFKGKIGPAPEVQKNKNVPIYKSKQG